MQNYKTMKELLSAAYKGLGSGFLEIDRAYQVDRNTILNDERPAIKLQSFTNQSYNGPSLRDFHDRLAILRDVAIQKLNKITDLAMRDRQRAILEEMFEQYKNELDEHCEIDAIPLSDLDLDKNKAKVKEKIIKAQESLQAFLFDALLLTEPAAFQNATSIDKALLRYMDEESKLTAERGRPDFINVYCNPDTQREDVFVSVQRTVDWTIPSTERYNEHPYKGKLPNFVQCGIYQDGDSPKPLFTGYRHSSYPPIKERDDFRREKGAAAIVKSMLTELARQELALQKRTPLTLNLSSLTLLTPYHRTDMLVPAGEEEHRQLLESYNAVMMYNGRMIELEIDGQNVDVTLNVSMLNAPGNPAGVTISKEGTWSKTLVHSKLEDDINAQGMSEFIQLACRKISKPQKAKALIDDLKAIFDQKNSDITRLKDELKQANKSLADSIEIGTTKWPTFYKQAKSKVKRLQDEIFKIERERMAACRQYVKKHRGEIQRFLGNLRDDKNPDLQTEELFVQTLMMYMDGKVDPIEYGARYLLACQKMGQYVDFYCKSGEDRTGRMQNMVEELCIFYQNHRRYPAYDMTTQSVLAADKRQQHTIAVAVNEFSVSRDITGANSIGARGLQITDKLGIFRADSNAKLHTSVGDTLGKTAKGVYALTSPVKKMAAKKVTRFNDRFLIDTQRRKKLKHSLESRRANVLLKNQNSALGFTSRLSSRKSSDSKPAPTTRATVTSPTYTAHRLSHDEIIVTEKKYESVGVLGQIEKDIHTVRDVTKVPEGGLSVQINEELAIEQAFAMVSPPFSAEASLLVLSGTDDEQVARIHAVLLVLKSQMPSLHSLVIEVEGSSQKPAISEDPHEQKKNDQDFIHATLSAEAKNNIGQNLTEYKSLIAKQKQMKYVVAMERAKEGELDMVEGTEITLPGPKKS